MSWYCYLAYFFAGLFLANGTPHFVRGVCGERFQTPFAKPPGVGESSPLVNVVWGWCNLVAGCALLWRFPPIGTGWLVTGLGTLLMGIFLAWHFGRARKNL